MQELSDAAAVLAEGSLAGPLDRQRRLRWAERLRVTQSSLPTRVRHPNLPYSCAVACASVTLTCRNVSTCLAILLRRFSTWALPLCAALACTFAN